MAEKNLNGTVIVTLLASVIFLMIQMAKMNQE
jgi:hypothetical protein